MATVTVGTVVRSETGWLGRLTAAAGSDTALRTGVIVAPDWAIAHAPPREFLP